MAGDPVRPIKRLHIQRFPLVETQMFSSLGSVQIVNCGTAAFPAGRVSKDPASFLQPVLIYFGSTFSGGSVCNTRAPAAAAAASAVDPLSA
jgi:hypothetical protein